MMDLCCPWNLERKKQWTQTAKRVKRKINNHHVGQIIYFHRVLNSYNVFPKLPHWELANIKIRSPCGGFVLMEKYAEIWQFLYYTYLETLDLLLVNIYTRKRIGFDEICGIWNLIKIIGVLNILVPYRIILISLGQPLTKLTDHG
jgi:hypothetical protein